MSVWSGIGSTLGKQFAKRDALPFLAGAIGAFVLLPKFAYDESMYAVSFWYFFFIFGGIGTKLGQNYGTRTTSRRRTHMVLGIAHISCVLPRFSIGL